MSYARKHYQIVVRISSILGCKDEASCYHIALGNKSDRISHLRTAVESIRLRQLQRTTTGVVESIFNRLGAASSPIKNRKYNVGVTVNTKYKR